MSSANDGDDENKFDNSAKLRFLFRSKHNLVSKLLPLQLQTL